MLYPTIPRRKQYRSVDGTMSEAQSEQNGLCVMYVLI